MSCPVGMPSVSAVRVAAHIALAGGSRRDNCDSRHLEDHPEFEGRLTRRLARRLVADARVMTLRAAARRHGLSWHLINGVVKAWSDGAGRGPPQPPVPGASGR